MTQKNTRALAATIITELLTNNGSLSSHLSRHAEHEDYAMLQQLCYGVCRYYFELKAILAQLLKSPPRKKDRDIYCLLLLGVYQLRYMRIPDHASVNETVSAAAALQKSWARGLINAVLRNYLKQAEALTDFLQHQDLAVRYSHPEWLIAAIKADWPQHYEQILTENNSHPPMTLRVNLSKISRQDYLELLNHAGIQAEPGQLSPSAIYLQSPCQVTALPGFAAGQVSVQDEASQLVAPLLDLVPGLSVLDACAAPGGKTCHILECERSLMRLLAMDSNTSRLSSIQENLTRLQLRAEVQQGDASMPEQWWDGSQFDRILLDAPCSATGVIRRHPDIKLLRSKQETESLAAQQRIMLGKLWSVLKPGGLLVYTTCSVLKRENDLIIQGFLEQEASAKYTAIQADWGVECRFGRQLLPASKGTDGFFFSRLVKD